MKPQLKVRFNHKAPNLSKTFGMTDADWDTAFNYVFDRFERGKQASEIIEGVLNKADFSLSQKAVGVYLVGCFVGEDRVKHNVLHTFQHILDGDAGCGHDD